MKKRASTDTSLVWSSGLGRVCPDCGKAVSSCICKKARPAGDGIVRVRRESKGRGGKTVTVVTGVPGDDAALALLAGLAGSLAALRRRVTDAERAAAYACLVFFTGGAAFLLASDLFEFSWRYQLPALVTLPPAGAFAITVLLLRHRARRRAGAPDPATTPAGQQATAVPPSRPDHGEPQARDHAPAN